jgi:hypothetical protein
MKLLSIGDNAKTVKSDKKGEFLTAIMYMRPTIDICPMSAIAACLDACLNLAGRGPMSNVQAARQRKTDLFLANNALFVDQLKADIVKAKKKADKKGVKLAVRPNGTSDIAFENIPGSNGLTLMSEFPDVQFYDYTKLPGRKVPANYHLTVSYSGANPAYARKVMKTKHNIAVVFRGEFPEYFNGRKVINGDLHDLRFTDTQNVVVGLSAKGPAKKDTSGFVVDVELNTIAIAA